MNHQRKAAKAEMDALTRSIFPTTPEKKRKVVVERLKKLRAELVQTMEDYSALYRTPYSKFRKAEEDRAARDILETEVERELFRRALRGGRGT